MSFRVRKDVEISTKLNFRFHDPNAPGAAADAILEVFFDVNRPKVDAALRKELGGSEYKETEQAG